MKDSNGQPNDKLIPITIRISAATYDTVSSLADEYHVKKADIIRLAIDGNLERYLGRIRYIDDAQAKVIHKNIITLGNVLIDIRDQLRRIGVNYNREIRLRNARRKKADVDARKKQAIKNKTNSIFMNTLNEESEIDKEIEDIMKDSKLLDRDELNQLIHRVEEAISKAGDDLCMYQ